MTLMRWVMAQTFAGGGGGGGDCGAKGQRRVREVPIGQDWLK